VVAGDGVGSRFRTENADELGTELELGGNKFVWLGATKVFESFTFAFVESPAGWLWCHAYGYDQDRSTFIVECSPDTWRGLGFDQLDLGASLALLQQLFAAQLDGHQLMAQPRAGDTMPWQNFATVRNRRWHLDNVALMGDAAHTTHFSIGSGTKLALEDAMELAGALTRHGDVPTALSEYESHRRQALRPAQQNARYSARWFENVTRYTQLDVEQFADLMDRRRSTALAHLPPSVYLRLRRLADDNRVLRRQWERLRSRARPLG
jgi:2-polyprenyl-6-methoxyphenol hydroxylase-like FAD-dependent oxidoreductase